MNQIEYRAYLKSDEWIKRKNLVSLFWNYRCAVCNSPDNLQVHHRSYKNLGHELMNDLILLCSHCHATVHSEIV